MNWLKQQWQKLSVDHVTDVAVIGWAAFLTMALRYYGVPTWLAVILAGVVIGGFKEIVLDKVLATDPNAESWRHAILDTAWWLAGALLTILVRKLW